MNTYSVIIPCHNEARSIAKVIEAVRRHVPSAQIVVVDDGSTDNTSQIVSALQDVTLIRLSPNRGKGVALQKSFEAATGDVLLLMDGDGQDDPADFPAMMQQAEAGVPFVNGSKFIGAIEKGGITRINYWGNKLMSLVVSLLFGAKITDSQSGFRAVKKEMVRRWKLRSVQYEIETEMLCKALRSGERVVEVPVTRKARTAGKTGLKRIRHGLRIFWTILKERASG